jgi:hypothetical protein
VVPKERPKCSEASVAGPPSPISEEDARSYLLRALKESKNAAWLTLPGFCADVIETVNAKARRAG